MPENRRRKLKKRKLLSRIERQRMVDKCRGMILRSAFGSDWKNHCKRSVS